MKVSVITVVYNSVSVLEKTIQSVISQDYSDFEFIILDGNSSDGSREIIEKYKDYLAFYESKPDSGVYDAMNKAVFHANGEWVVFMNAGDVFYDKNVLKDVFENNLFDGYGVIFGNTIQKFDFGERVFTASDFSENASHITFNHQSCFTRKSLLLQYPFNLEYKICADFDSFFRMKLNGINFLHIDNIIAVYDNSDGISSKLPVRKFKEELKITGKTNVSLKVFIFSIKINVKTFIKWLLPEEVVLKYKQKRFL